MRPRKLRLGCIRRAGSGRNVGLWHVEVHSMLRWVIWSTDITFSWIWGTRCELNVGWRDVKVQLIFRWVIPSRVVMSNCRRRVNIHCTHHLQTVEYVMWKTSTDGC